MIKSLLDYCLENGRPELLEQWDTERNGGLMPADVAAGSSVKRYWLCPKGHSFESKPGFRTTRSHGCPYCANRAVLPGFNDLATVRPDLAKEWHPDRLQRSCVTKSGACRAVGHGTKRNAHPAAGHAGQQPQGMVDLRKRPCLAEPDRPSRRSPAFQLPGLCREHEQKPRSALWHDLRKITT